MIDIDPINKVVNATYTKYFNNKGELHNPDGPAVIWNDGDTEWYINGVIHRDNGPALYWKSMGRFCYYRHGKYHRYDGPAEIELYDDGDLALSKWSINGRLIDENDYINWLEEMRMDILNLTDDDKIMIDLYWTK